MRQKVSTLVLPDSNLYKGCEGWVKSKVNPNLVLEPFKRLWLKPGFTLGAYQFHQSGNGHGVVWAAPIESEFPSPHEFIDNVEDGYRLPRPPDAIEVMDALEGDGTPRSYLQASILCRELWEFGAIWHGVDWRDVTVVDREPVRFCNADEDAEWGEPKPTDWRPSASLSDGTCKAVFYGTTQQVQMRVIRFTDTYEKGTYRFEVDETCVWAGPGGFIY
jgi:hypothetical protein